MLSKILKYYTILNCVFVFRISLLKEKINKVIIEDSDEDNGNFILMQKLIKETTNKLKKIEYLYVFVMTNSYLVLTLKFKFQSTLSETQVLNQVDPEKIDWMKISKIDVSSFTKICSFYSHF